MEKGVVDSFNKEKGFGFITTEDKQRVFVHFSVIQTDGFKTLDPGEEVSLMLAEGAKGLVAVKVIKEDDK